MYVAFVSQKKMLKIKKEKKEKEKERKKEKKRKVVNKVIYMGL